MFEAGSKKKMYTCSLYIQKNDHRCSFLLYDPFFLLLYMVVKLTWILLWILVSVIKGLGSHLYRFNKYQPVHLWSFAKFSLCS